MKNFGKVKSTKRPPEIEITQNAVFIASNIVPYTETYDTYIIEGFEYNYAYYTKDQYIQNIATENANAIAQLQEELRAAKILLGVE